MDTDVIVKGTFEEFMDYDFIAATEYHPNVVVNESSLKLLDQSGKKSEVLCLQSLYKEKWRV